MSVRPERLEVAPHSKPLARGRVRRTTGRDKHTADNSRY